MKRATLVMIAGLTALLGTGCTTHCNATTVNLYWVDFTDASGTARRCSDPNSGVASIDILVDGNVEVQNVACQPNRDGVEGIGLTNFTPGSYTFEVRAFDANGAELYRDVTTQAVPNTCGAIQVDTHPLAIGGDLNVAYGFTNGACSTPTAGSGFPTTFIWYHLLDQNNQVASAVDFTNTPTAIPCSDASRIFTIPGLGFGTYTISGIEEVEIEADNRTVIVNRFNCVPSTPFIHATQGDTLTAPAMVLAAPGTVTTCF